MADPSETVVHHPAVLRLQTVGDALLHLLATPQEPAAITRKLLPRAAPVLFLLSTDDDLVYVLTETYLKGRPQVTSNSAALLKLLININTSWINGIKKRVFHMTLKVLSFSSSFTSNLWFLVFLRLGGLLSFRPRWWKVKHHISSCNYKSQG